ncbi:MAG: RnfABCDGE type electron transport complex subunit D [Fibrobacteres bacterium]|nr:RnfABCDGE type electron transport complex subunit D [Fibrobacterota bacterium]
MNRVLASLAPVVISAIYFFGWRVVAVLAVTAVAGFLTEWYMQSKKGGKVSTACFVTTTLLALSLPPAVPLWIAAVGSVIAIFFAKEAFGGFGKNPFNPAIVGRAFIYVSFPVEMASQFSPAYHGFPGGFAAWSASGGVDALSAATPLFAFRNLSFSTDLLQLFTGSIGGGAVTAAGSMGEVSALVLLFSAVYLIATGTAKWQLTFSTLLGASILSFILHNIAGIAAVPSVPATLFSGALMFVAVFMVTDPVSAPRQQISQWIYGLFIGMMIVLFRYKAAFVGGAAFAVLLGNIIGPSIDMWIAKTKKAKA